MRGFCIILYLLLFSFFRLPLLRMIWSVSFMTSICAIMKFLSYVSLGGFAGSDGFRDM